MFHSFLKNFVDGLEVLAHHTLNRKNAELGLLELEIKTLRSEVKAAERSQGLFALVFGVLTPGFEITEVKKAKGALKRAEEKAESLVKEIQELEDSLPRYEKTKSYIAGLKHGNASACVASQCEM